MTRVRVESFTISLDGYGAGPDQDINNPLGVGPWADLNWKGWWGDNPPYHVPVFVLTHHPRPPIEMEGGTTFYFVTQGIHEALDQARQAANGLDVRIGGGPHTIQQYLRAGLIDELHIAMSPVVLGRGERLFEGVDLGSPGRGIRRRGVIHAGVSGRRRDDCRS